MIPVEVQGIDDHKSRLCNLVTDQRFGTSVLYPRNNPTPPVTPHPTNPVPASPVPPLSSFLPVYGLVRPRPYGSIPKTWTETSVTPGDFKSDFLETEDSILPNSVVRGCKTVVPDQSTFWQKGV